jgi:hypothetical protein
VWAVFPALPLPEENLKKENKYILNGFNEREKSFRESARGP